MKPFEKKILTGAIAASFLLGGAGLLTHANAEDAGTTGPATSAVTKKNQGERGQEKRQGFEFRSGNVIKETAALLGVDATVVMDELKQGKSLLQLAQDKGLTKEDYLQKLTEAEKEAIAAAVTAGKLTQEQADKQTANLTDRLTKEIENAGFGKGGKLPGGPGIGKEAGFRGGNILKETATLLGVDESAVQEALKAGKTLSQFAQEKGLSEADYLQKLTDAQNKSIDEAVSAGKLTQEQADKAKTALADRLKKEITSTNQKGFEGKGGFGGKGGFDGKRGFGGLGDPEALAKAADATAEELKTGMSAGKSLVEIAQEKGIGEDQLIANIKDGLTDQIKQFVEMKKQPRGN
ncbi:hypothetical protein [Paenibacillus piri]|uniref:LysM domain-containing protein n=1 Tax=Paenibacillus piri TaxID=2547395 RepID=A0A4R5KBF8_9BACL|nr:hypothetical protein [Paenibacillus piri]TDF92376.1 hypothetical protein E1757_30395 [Paenibacillus piri]